MCSAVAYGAIPTPPVAALPSGLGSPCDWAPWYGSSNCINAVGDCAASVSSPPAQPLPYSLAKVP
jgi:hypothetical protein